jgi:CRISPR-associated endonuclease/helicase Cas3
MTFFGDVRLFWGKARPLVDASRTWHPVLYHGLDVAAVSAALLRRWTRLSARLQMLLGWDQATLAMGVPALAALHDVGKLTRPFQAKVPALWPAGSLGPIPLIPPRDPGHGATGLHLLLTLDDAGRVGLFEGWRPSDVDLLLGPFLGHHGRPVAVDVTLSDGELFGRNGAVIEAGAAYVEVVRALFGLKAGMPPVERLEAATWPLAGLAALSDWIGSRQEWFPYVPPDLAPDTYWHQHALPSAEVALERAGVESSEARTFGGFAAIAGRNRSPSPLQIWAEEINLPEGPLLVLIEDVTGSGKTEAALVLAHRLMASGRASGLVMALPTMATANAMFGRLGEIYHRLFAEGARPSLALAHGRADLDPRFRAAVAGIAVGDAPPDSEQRGDGSAAECAAWLADDRRKAFLADVGVATVDQAILAVLPAKHQPVRLLGLAQRVLVVDEAHAYDAYVAAELEQLLAAHAANGGCAVVLSATLPAATRRRLMGAFAKAIGAKTAALARSDYPLATVVAAAGAIEAPLVVRPDLARRVRVERLADAHAALTVVTEAAGQGAAVAWVRNTVDDALDAADRARAFGLEPLLFHARFAMGDRLKVEMDVLGRFGPKADASLRPGVLIATQVIEQSLDLDFDLLVTDLAPVDLLLQRMGRLWRHPARDPRRPIEGPRLLVVSPEPVDAPASDWVTTGLRGTSIVYPEHALLWRSARALFRRGEVRVPEDVRALVEEAYDPAGDVPQTLAGAADRVRGKQSAQTWVALTNTLNFSMGYLPASGQWAAEHQVPTRDAEEQVTFRLGRIADGEIVPWIADSDPRRAWAMSEVKVRRSRAMAALPPASAPVAMINRTCTAWPEYERTMPLLVLEQAAGNWCGLVEDRRGRVVEVTYHAEEGLRLEAKAR